ncbi:MAG: hypothetical protein ACNA7O_20390 [Rhodobacterales bacterium]
MARRPRPNHNPAFKVKVAVALSRAKTLIELAQDFGAHLNQIDPGQSGGAMCGRQRQIVTLWRKRRPYPI